MRQNLYPVSFEDFQKIIEVGNYPIMYAIFQDYIYVEMAIENSIFASKKYLDSIQKEMQLGIDDDSLAQIRFFFRKYLKTKNYYQFFPTEEDREFIENIITYNKLIVREANVDIEYNPNYASKKEDDVYIYIYHLDKLMYKLEKS